MDIKSPEARSRNMALIKSKNTKPEMYIRSLFFRNGLRFRVNYNAVKGRPDLFFTKQRVAVFVHGCYWHRHKNCQYAYTPKSNVAFWMNKLEGNRRHDEQVVESLNSENIRVLVIWECTVKRVRKLPDLEKQLCESAESFIYRENTLIKEL